MTPGFEETVAEVLKLQDDLEDLKSAASDNVEDLSRSIALHREGIERLEGQILKANAPYVETIACMTDEIKARKEYLGSILLKDGKKTVELDIAKVQMKTTKSVQVLNKTGLVDILAKMNGGIDNGIKAFNLPYLRKAMELDDAVPEDIATFELNRKVHVTWRT